MRSRIFVGTALLVGMFGAALVAHNGTTKHSSIINLLDPVLVKGEMVMGPVLIVHDDLKMAKGEPCTTFYRFDVKTGPQEALVSFHCVPVERRVVAETTLTTNSQVSGCKRLVEYQLGGDSEAHGVPTR
jgi:hypothetical protein